ncbi:MAG: hypothetical protein ACLT46_09490 [Hungatella sp.]
MSKKKKHKKSCKKYTTEKLLLATATIQLIQAVIELLTKLNE